MKETEGALFNTDDLIEVDRAMVGLLKARAAESPTGRFRLCLHHSTSDAVQEMIIAHCRGSYSRPHRHPGRSVSYKMIEGRMAVVLFDDAGGVVRTMRLGPPGGDRPFAFRLTSGGWYMPIGESDAAVFCETLAGPNVEGQATEYATWAPAPADAEAAAAFLARLEAKLQ